MKTLKGQVAITNKDLSALFADFAESFKTSPSAVVDASSLAEENTDPSSFVFMSGVPTAVSDTARNCIVSHLSTHMDEEHYSITEIEEAGEKATVSFMVSLDESVSSDMEDDDEDGDFEEDDEDETDDEDDEDEDDDGEGEEKGKKDKTSKPKVDAPKKDSAPQNDLTDLTGGGETSRERRILSVLGDDQSAKLVGSLYMQSCGKNRKLLPEFWRELDEMCADYRKSSGYEPDQDADVSDEDVAAELMDVASMMAIQDTSKKSKSKFKEGRGGLLSAMMGALSGTKGDAIIAKWDAGEIEDFAELMFAAVETVTNKLAETHPEPVLPEVDEDEDEADQDDTKGDDQDQNE